MRKMRSKAEWIRICKNFEGSGDTAVVFAHEHKINLSTLHGWRFDVGTGRNKTAADQPLRIRLATDAD